MARTPTFPLPRSLELPSRPKQGGGVFEAKTSDCSTTAPDGKRNRNRPPAFNIATNRDRNRPAGPDHRSEFSAPRQASGEAPGCQRIWPPVTRKGSSSQPLNHSGRGARPFESPWRDTSLLLSNLMSCPATPVCLTIPNPVYVFLHTITASHLKTYSQPIRYRFTHYVTTRSSF